MTDAPVIRDIRPEDAGEVLTIQRAAFASEALIYGDPDMPPLTQTLEELAAELVENLGCVAIDGHRLVGAVRARRAGDLLLIGRLAIAPDQQGAGLGSTLLAAVEERGRRDGATEAELFTGGLSEANQRLYEREGYHRSETTPDGEIFYRKPLR
ncbi:GNAT family N-acetyltransferase [Microbacterium sp. 5K110]|jgi:GNAT superfamily N-acetyltransferase|uniref:GNAT family N-acetyltransferase n=1 Tax=unclassified Microbacterium TaxID=2609290 RepID=UPI0010FEA39D|nr:GNAT family N-acetyltransferase [Microbacterium sp. 5K110]TLF30309.1 GNAT family N-acetyltransferase [Microbacterium sp. 5K110]